MNPISPQNWFGRNKPRMPHFKSLPIRRQLSMFFAAFCLFAVIGFFVDLMTLGRLPYPVVIVNAIFSGFVAVMYVFLGTRYPNYYMIVWTVIQVLLQFGFSRMAAYVIAHSYVHAPRSEDGIRFAAISILVLVICSYSFFIRFIRKEGQESYRIKNELELAHGIQKTLAPVIEMHTAHFELYGRSEPSDKVGGDIVDALLLEDGSCVAYVADIAGHGLQAGILMGMLKTAARTALLDGDSIEPRALLPTLMDRLNRVLPEVKEPQMYATFAGLRLHPDGSLYYALAAHPPILHYRKSEASRTEQISTEQFPLGLLPVGGFSSEMTAMAPGDMMIVVTDGILEACNKIEEEFGLDRLQAIIAANATASLAQISDVILNATRSFGKQIDDQTLLLVRKF